MIVELEDFKQKISGLQPVLESLKNALKSEDDAQELQKLEAESTLDGFWNDLDNSQKVLQRIKQLSNKNEKYDKLAAGLSDLTTLCQIAI